MAHDRSYLDATAFIWTKDPNLVVLCYPAEQYASFGMTLSSASLRHLSAMHVRRPESAAGIDGQCSYSG